MTEECNGEGKVLFNSLFDRLRQGDFNPLIADSLASLLADCVEYTSFCAQQRHDANLALGVEKGSKVPIGDDILEQRIMGGVRRLYNLFPEQDKPTIQRYLDAAPRDLAICVNFAAYHRNK